MTSVAFQGVSGAYSETAIYQYFGPNTKTIGCASLVEVFQAVETNRVDLGILPVENALTGSHPQAYELLKENNFGVSDIKKQPLIIIR